MPPITTTAKTTMIMSAPMFGVHGVDQGAASKPARPARAGNLRNRK